MSATWATLPEMRDHLQPLPAAVLEALQEAYRAGYTDGHTRFVSEAEAIIDKALAGGASPTQIDDGAAVSRALRHHRG